MSWHGYGRPIPGDVGSVGTRPELHFLGDGGGLGDLQLRFEL